MKMKKITSQKFGKFAKKFLSNFNKYYGVQVVSGTYGSFEWKTQANGLIKYRINNSDKSFDELTRKQILKEIKEKGEIILMEGKNYFTVMKPPQDVSEVV